MLSIKSYSLNKMLENIKMGVYVHRRGACLSPQSCRQWEISETNMSMRNSLADEVKVDINVLCATMECGVLGKLYGTLIVTEQICTR